jgi:serine/threonine protein kinase
MEMVETEIEILKRVNHPNIIRLQEIFETGDQVQLVLELYVTFYRLITSFRITGGELFDKIVEYQFYSEKDAAAVVAQVISAVGHLHDAGIVHRDLKPENLLLSSNEPDAKVKLADFGLSAIINPGEKLTKAVGTPGYIGIYTTIIFGLSSCST